MAVVGLAGMLGGCFPCPACVTADIDVQDYWNLGAMDWDRETTKPSQKKLLELGLDDVVEDLWP